MTSTYKNHHDYLHHLYKTGKGLSLNADSLSGSARIMLQKTEILGNLDKAKGLLTLYDELRISGFKGNTGESLFGVAHRALSECYAVILDDLMLLSAFEIYAKSLLIKKSYVIHEIKKPKSLATKQRKTPVHIRSIKAVISKGEEVD